MATQKPKPAASEAAKVETKEPAPATEDKALVALALTTLRELRRHRGSDAAIQGVVAAALVASDALESR